VPRRQGDPAVVERLSQPLHGLGGRHRPPAAGGIAEAREGEFPQDKLTAWPGTITMHGQRIAACAPGQLLTVELWDQA
jgi:hypothetical protein